MMMIVAHCPVHDNALLCAHRAVEYSYLLASVVMTIICAISSRASTNLAMYSALNTLIMFGLKHKNPEFMKRRGIYIQTKV